jgi:threonine dehydrogenase-like Zn-dependent dehydrogenase
MLVRVGTYSISNNLTILKSYCRTGFTCRCVESTLFGIPSLPGGQEQYIRVPKAGGTLYPLTGSGMGDIKETALLLLGDILPTGAFAAVQALRHPKVAGVINGQPYAAGIAQAAASGAPIQEEDQVVTFAILGLGPVGLVSDAQRGLGHLLISLQCAALSLLHLLVRQHGHAKFTIVAVDLLPARREKMSAIYNALPPNARGSGSFHVSALEDARELMGALTSGRGANAVLEVVGNNYALELAYHLVQPFGVISSVGVHQAPPLPFTGRAVYNKNVSLEFGRCPVRALFPLALEILRERQDIFGAIGTETSLVERVVPMTEAKYWYEEFNNGRCGKVVFDPWA